MSAPPQLEILHSERPQDLEEAKTIPDQQMVFRTNEATPTREANRKMVLKSSKGRLKMRRSTPAPPFKGNGRKRLDISPFSEDKQLRKGIDFGDASGSVMEGPRCKGAIFPATPHDGSGKNPQMVASEIDPNLKDQEMATPLPRANISIGDANATDSGQVAGDVVADSDVVGNLPCHPWSKGDASAGTKWALVGELVNLPEMELGTKPLLESALVPSQLDESHVGLAVALQMQPKGDNILLLANLDSADMLDTMAAQPLLAGGQPEVDQMVVTLYTEPLSAAEEPLLTLMSSSLVSDVMPNDPVAQPMSIGGRPEEGHLANGPQLDQIPNPARILDSTEAFVPSFEEFPPLVKGRTLKLRDSFEAGKLHHGAGSVWPRDVSAGRSSATRQGWSRG